MKTLFLYILLFFSINICFSQSTFNGHLGGIPAFDYLGWDNFTIIPVQIRHDNAGIVGADIEFWTRNFRRMIILGTNSGTNDGFVGIGANLATYATNFNLDVQNEINVNFSGTTPISSLGIGYRIEGNTILQIPGILNTFVGANTGSSWTNGESNTLVGNRAGASLATGSFNTFIGRDAGSSVDDQDYNTYVGESSGTNNTGEGNSFFGHHTGFNVAGGNNNTFVGQHAGFGDIGAFGGFNTFIGYLAATSFYNARDNTIVGALAGENLYDGIENAFLGNLSGRFNTQGSHNTFVGFRAGQNNIDGNDITLLGYWTHALPSPALTNATAVGSRAGVMTSNSMILGNNDVNVGIGLSFDATGPQNKLEINDTINSGSGLRFRQLTAGDTTTFTPNGKVLTVDGNGDVVLTDDIGGNGSVTSCSATLTTDVGFITKWTTLTALGGREICRSQGIFEDNTWPNHVGIGVGNTPNTNMKVHMKGDLYIESDPGHSWGGDIYMNDASLLNIKPVLAMYGLAGYGALSVGHDAGNSDFYSNGSSAFGGSTFVGFQSARDIDGNTAANSIFGYWAGYNLYNGSENNIFGYRAGLNLTSGNQNIIIGTDAANGAGSGLFEVGDANIFIGHNVQNGRLPIGQENIVIGKEAYITTENSSTTSADNNVVIGSGARAYDNVTRSGPDEIQKSVVIGDRAEVWCDSCIVLGRNDVHRVGIGTYQPSSTAVLDVDPPTGFPWAAIFRDTAIQVNSVHVASDQNLKEMITPLANVSNLLSDLNTYSFKYKKEQFPNVGIDGGFHYGFLAQELELLFPMLVSNQTADAMHDSTGNEIAPATPYKTINYLEIIPLLVQGFQEQKQIVDSLKIVISNCCASPINPEAGNRSSIHLSNRAAIILNQNVPNPFRDKTEITYDIPESVTEAAILFYDQSGKILNTFEISTRGQGSLTVYGDDLTGGIYSYTLMVNGEPVQTKKMMKE